MESSLAKIDFTRPVNYRILRQALTVGSPFLQVEVAKNSGAANGQVSRLIRWLEVHHHATRRTSDGRYEITQPASLVLAVLPYQRVMAHALEGTAKVRLTMDEASRAMDREGGTLCLESALAAYSGYFRTDRLSIYHPRPRSLLARLERREEGLLPVDVYRIDIPLVGDAEGPDARSPWRRTSRYRTLVDLVCNNRAYAAKDLFEELWGVQLG